MSERRSRAPVQRDPIRERLGREGAPRDVRCPNCGVTHSTTRLWHMRCPECDFTWIDRSRRTVVDKARDNLPNVLIGIILGGSFIAMIGGLIAFSYALFIKAVDRHGLDNSVGIFALLIACAVAIGVIGALRFQPRLKAQRRRSPLRPDGGKKSEASRRPEGCVDG